jgi:hypothetical protein
MGTRSVIAIENDNGTVAGVYCHWDGYLAGVGHTLIDHYTDREQVRRLVAGGAMSSLGAAVEPPQGVEHSFASPANGVTVFYHRDRGEGARPEIMEQDTRRGWETRCRNMGAEYLYLFTSKGWRWKPAGARGPWRVLRKTSADRPKTPAAATSTGYPGQCPEGMDWSSWLAFNNVD